MTHPVDAARVWRPSIQFRAGTGHEIVDPEMPETEAWRQTRWFTAP